MTFKQSPTGWELRRADKPYFIKGAGGEWSMEQLAAAGANSIRTWSTDNAEEILDKAHDLGLTVTLGIWLGHERHGFDYSNKEDVARQRKQVRKDVLRFKDHPALLLWGIGNEMEGFAEGDNPTIWSAVEEIARMVKSLDPHHPTMTVTAEIGGSRVDFVQNKLPSIDIHGVNSYAGASTLEQRLLSSGAKKPVILTEYGPPGPWEAQTTSWGAPIELTSTEKSIRYEATYNTVASNKSGLLLGSYAFLWGHKVEATETWFGMFLEDSKKLAAVDLLTKKWSGASSENLSPQIEPLRLNGAEKISPGEDVRITASMSDPNQDPLSARWFLRRESSDYLTGGDFRRKMPDLDGVILEGNVSGAQLRMPTEPGAYRLFVYVDDGKSAAATANIPLYVEGDVRPVFPVDLYYEGFEAMPWSPSGWMGNTEKLSVDGSHEINTRSGEKAIQLRYEGKYGWAGVAWQHPENNWGELEGGIDLTGASALELWAKGEYGGELIEIGVGLIAKNKSYSDSAISSKNQIRLTREWKKIILPLKDLDLASIKTGFVINLTGRSTPVTVYLDDIRYIK